MTQQCECGVSRPARCQHACSVIPAVVNGRHCIAWRLMWAGCGVWHVPTMEPRSHPAARIDAFEFGALQVARCLCPQADSAALAQVLHVLKGHSGPVRCVSFSGDGAKIASGSDDRTLCVWSVETGKVRLMTSAHPFRMNISTVVAEIRRTWRPGELRCILN